jgi:hypothetical protein
MIELYRELRSQNRLTTRVLCAPEAEPYAMPWTSQAPLPPEEYLNRLNQARDLVDRSDDLFRVDGVTIGRGGPLWPGLTLMREPYEGPYGDKTTGRSFISSEKTAEAIRFCSEHGLRLNIVTYGLAETDTYLDQLEALGRRPLETDGRAWLLQHLFFAEPEQLQRFAALGLDVTTSMSFPWGKGELIRERVGQPFLADFIPLARMLDAGLRVACSTDWGPKNVFEHIALAVEPYYAASGQAAATPGISRQQALAGWTREAAHVLRWEGIGSLEPGNHADLAVIDRDPLTCTLDELPDTRVITTMLGGQVVAGEDFAGDI